jgi:hypothetical protein
MFHLTLGISFIVGSSLLIKSAIYWNKKEPEDILRYGPRPSTTKYNRKIAAGVS